MNSKRYGYPGSDTDAQATFTHEYAHCMDRTWKEFITAYGQAGSHFAIFNEMIEFPGEATYVQSAIQRIKVESDRTRQFSQQALGSPWLHGNAAPQWNANILRRERGAALSGKDCH